MIGDFYECPNCRGKRGFHNFPCNGMAHVYAPMPPQPGTVPVPTLTEADVRRIVDEELDKRQPR